MFAASSASGSWQYLFASTRQASASCTCRNIDCIIDNLKKYLKTTKLTVRNSDV